MPAYLRFDTARLALFGGQTCTHCYLEWYDHAIVKFKDTLDGCKIELVCPKLLPTYALTRNEKQLSTEAKQLPQKGLRGFRYQRELLPPPKGNGS